jgi:predicted AAA+ superfamily ATPase
MAKSNRDRVGDVMDALKAGLGPYVLREYKARYGPAYAESIRLTLTTDAYQPPATAFDSEKKLLEGIDVQGWLNLMVRKWDDVFRDKLGKNERSYVNELSGTRNDWAHQKPVTSAGAQRAADTAALLLNAIGANEQTLIVQEIARELMRLRFDEEAKQSVKKTATAAPAEETPMLFTQAGLKPWRLVVKPHPDVATGRYVAAEFAANLADVVAGKAEPEYGEADEFFRRTYLTEGLVSLLANGLRRLSGNGGDPVVQLQTSFGGGKTHSMLAMYHLCDGKIGLSQIPDGEKIAKLAGSNVEDRTDARRAVIVGTAFSATEPRRHKTLTTRTLWGEIAYQLGGAEGYKLVEQADLAGVAPGSDTLVQLLEQHGPALIIIDELVAFARNLYNVSERVPAGSFDSLMSFVQSLTEAVKRASDAVLLVSIPESDVEIGGEGGRAALDVLTKVIGRIESVWKPVTATESFEIVRRRLFAGEMDFAARDAVIKEFRKLYREQTNDFPTGVAESEYGERLKAAYPIHPELFDRLYQDWSTLERFQRTRGVLRLMAAVIHQLWVSNDTALMIMPGNLPLWAASVRNEMTRYLPENWSAILDTDIDGDESRPFALDKAVPMLGQYSACRRIARSIFVGSAPSAAGATARGVEEVRIRLAVVQPGDQVAIFNDALRRMSNQLTYLYNEGSRYWFDTRPTVNRMAQDRAANMPLDDVHLHIIEKLRAVKPDRDKFAFAHVAPQSSADIADEARARVVVLDPQHTHKRGSDNSEAMGMAMDCLQNRGATARLYRNMLVFIAPDANEALALEKAVRDRLAWDSIQDQADELNLDAQQVKQVKSNLKRADETVAARLQETYSWLIVPVQNDPTGPIEVQASRMSGTESYYDRAFRKLRQGEWLITKWSPDNLRMELDRFLWRDQLHVKLKQLWEYFAQYCYLPRLADQDVLIEAVREGLKRTDGPFAYATMATAEGGYKGLVQGQAGATVYFNDSDVLVQPDVARAQESVDRSAADQLGVQPTLTGDGQPGLFTPPTVTPSKPSRPEPAAKSFPTRYYGTVVLNPLRMNKEVATIVEEIIQRLAGQPGTDIHVTLEISASRMLGFDEATTRTVSENSRTLKFSSHEFDGE